MSQKTSPSTIAVNKKARHLYELSEFTEAGIVLTGPEVKSIRAGKVTTAATPAGTGQAIAQRIVGGGKA